MHLLRQLYKNAVCDGEPKISDSQAETTIISMVVGILIQHKMKVVVV